jgi:prolyl-tRNA synthetase
VSPLALNKDTFAKVLTVVDASITSSSSIFAVHALSSSSTVFLSGSDIISYLRTLETDDVKLQMLEVEDMAGASASAATQTSKPPVKEKEEAKIEGAVQIAIGVKKEVDFPAWYTNVIFIKNHIPAVF